jgi:Mrp family chromosome partitioning ATPase/capsular polysaccharide biosynthesis protein
MTLREFLHVLQRRKWIVLQTVVLVVAVVVVISVRQPKLYQAQARVLLSNQNLASQLTGVNTGGGGGAQSPDRSAQTQASVARTTAVAAQTLATVPHTGLTPGRFLGESSVTPNPNADILGFTVTSRNPQLARRLVNAYAYQYTIYRRALDNASIVRAREGVKAEIDKLASQPSAWQLRAQLVNRDQTLATMEALQTSNASVLQTASGAHQTQPRTRRNALLAVVVGLILGIAFAYLWETLDTSVRNADDIRKHLTGLPLLARLPPPPKRLDGENRLVTLAAPDSPEAEAFRMLRTNLEFVMLGRGLQTIMVTSAIEQEGKSTTVANLAVALARVGRRVVLIDLDLRRPRVDRFFKVDGPGVVQVALGHVDLDSALTPVDLPGTSSSSLRSRLNGDGAGATSLVRGTLHVLPAGAFPPDRSAFFESQALETILGLLRERADIVLVDAPPVLQVGDAMALSRRVDGILVVARVNHVRRPMLLELERLLAMTPAQAIGFVAAVATSEVYETAYGGYAAIEEADVLPAEAGGSLR